MSEDLKDTAWELGMELPSRKLTHGKKKKQKDKPQAKKIQIEASPTTTERVQQPDVTARSKELAQQPEATARSTELAQQPDVTARSKELAQQPDVTARSTELTQQTDLTARSIELTQQTDLTARSFELAKQPEASLRSTERVQQSDLAPSEALGLRAVPAGAEVPVVSLPVSEASTEEPDTVVEEDEARPFYSRWQWALLMFFTPAVILLTLAYGRLGYVHDVPDHVRSEVPAYQQGEAFLVLKPWWFGPPIFTLDDYKVPSSDYPLSRADYFARYKIELGDYARIVDGPRVLWTFRQDLLN
ncbi:hypothetical protein OS242_17880 [Tumebacillus sp. DT12]|uniref:Peptidase S26 domain-containing protein n=1 Tax=Tumebacillus lacus TaxID=2995335 RepID=A0ABT3X4J1_9BACL|nr:hypothetical protein [Tumebacillus lacus]MCX7571817.1 hypothetical protein [Tumebacillus lacus]